MRAPIEVNEEMLNAILIKVAERVEITKLRNRFYVAWQNWIWNPFKQKDSDLWVVMARFVNNIKLIIDIFGQIISTTELIAHELYKKMEGKLSAVKLQAVAKTLDDIIIFTGWAKWLELFDDKIFKFLITFFIGVLNNFIGHDWIEKIRHTSATC